MFKLTTRTCFTAAVLLMLNGGVVLADSDGPPDDSKPEAMARIQRECRAQPYSMLLTIRRIREGRGLLTVDLHGDAHPELFLKKGTKLLRLWVVAPKGEAEVCLPVPHPGVYAASVFQDKNMNFRLDKGFLGIPAEPYGVSNDPPMNFGPPDFQDSAVAVNGPLTPVTIDMHN